ncbi:uncharacterized protein LOC118465941 isoform X1 [Anopheles albimanus]|uniref:uncharacterized protein LOC118465941 isoform X1 n=1 Tax=Anopheles albimanus TaxID=7167 RepID=UPI001640B23D|nr:uncharacterized protein LOC118465941 isoform X1 [Anopheles albimanus]
MTLARHRYWPQLLRRSIPPISSSLAVFLLVVTVCLCTRADERTSGCSSPQDCGQVTSDGQSKSKRSALPIMNDYTPYGAGKDLLVAFNTNSVQHDDGRGPPGKGRSGKDLLDESYQRTKELALNISSVQRAVLASQQARIQAAQNNGGRQNSNPDIQDIITGIVKLLNGNVNVQANPQPTRRHSATRINNRGPPRISEAQPLPNEYEGELGVGPQPPSTRPQAHDQQQQQQQQPSPGSQGPRPDHPVRPFLTGVPIPEQIVPSMQHTYRPGFVSQNRPPWQRPKPRPPISPNRRPIPPYKPYPTNVDYRPDGVEGLPPPPPPPPSSPLTIPTTNGGDPGNAIDNVTEKVIEDPPYDALAPSGGYSSYPTTTATEGEPDEESAVTTESTLVQQDSKESTSSSTASTPTEVQYTIESATSAASVMPAPGSYDPEVVPSVYEINSIEYLPSSGVLEATTTTTTTTSTPILLATSSSIEPSSSNSEGDRYEITATPTLDSSTASTLRTTVTTTAVPTVSSSPSSSIAPTTTTKLAANTGATKPSSPPPDYRFQPRPGLVLDDPDFKPGGAASSSNAIRTQNLPPFSNRPEIYTAPPPASSIPGTNARPNYGEIFDVTLSAIQGPGGSGGTGSQQTIKINPYYNRPPAGQPVRPDDGEASIILSASGTEGFVSIDGKRSYIDLFGTATDKKQPAAPSVTPVGGPLVRPTERPRPSKVPSPLQPGIIGTGYAVPETESPVHASPAGGGVGAPGQATGGHRVGPGGLVHSSRPKYPGGAAAAAGLPPVRIDTCIVGDDSTCDQAQNERCRTENGVSSCHCRPGYARRKHREPCRRIVSLMLSMRVDKIYERRIHWDPALADRGSEKHQQLSYEAIRAMDSAMSMTPFSDEFLEARVNGIYTINPSSSAAPSAGVVFVNYTVNLDENAETLRPALRSDIQRHLLGVIHRRNNNIGNSALYVEAPTGAVSSVQDVDECTSDELNDCDEEAHCTNLFGTFRCECNYGFRDPWADQPQRAGRECLSCPESYCNNRGSCSYDNANNRQVCKCLGSFYGTQCEIDGEVLGVAVGASVAAVVIIVLTLICLVMWSRKWQREHKNAMGSPVFGYLGNGQVKTPVMGQAPYQVTLEDRMRWAQIADVMAQANHYAVSYEAEPVGGGRPASAMYGYPNLQTIGSMNTLSLHGTLPMHTGTLPPVPLPRTLGLNRNGMRTLENSSSSEEEDRADLLGRNFNVPRPKSRSNASVTSGIYYDVDYAPTGAEQLYGGSTLGGTIGAGLGSSIGQAGGTTKSQSSIPMSTYTSSGRPTQSTYYK